jgi:DNA-binding NtrC family response regulator
MRYRSSKRLEEGRTPAYGTGRSEVQMEKKGQGCILIVEDEDSIRLTLRDYLKNKGYPVIVASDGVGAIKQLLDNDVELIVSDYRMDTLGGDYWIRFLKEYCAGRKVIITSGFLKPEFPIPFPVLYKPFDYSELEQMIATALEDATGDNGG